MPRKSQRRAKPPVAPVARIAPRRRAAQPLAGFPALVQAALDRGRPEEIADAALHDVFAAAVKLYAAKVERRGIAVQPFADGAVTATETVVAACAMIRAADLNLFDVAMWFHRAPQ